MMIEESVLHTSRALQHFSRPPEATLANVNSTSKVPYFCEDDL